MDGVARHGSNSKRRNSGARRSAEHYARNQNDLNVGVEEGTAPGMEGHQRIPPPATIPYQQRHGNYDPNVSADAAQLPSSARQPGRYEYDENVPSATKGDRRSWTGNDKVFPPAVGRV
jgi:hypothetical protein